MFSLRYSKIGCRRTHVLRGQARRSNLQAAFLSRSYLVQCRMYWAKVSQNADVLRSGWDVLVISGWTFFGKAFFDVRSYCNAFYMTCSRFLLHEPNRKNEQRKLTVIYFTLYQTSSEEQWSESTKRKSVTVCVSAVLRILLLLLTSQLLTASFVHNRMTRCQEMVHNSNTVRVIYENTHIFEKLMNSAFKQNQVWYNQISHFCRIRCSGEHESVVQDWLLTEWPVKGWNKEKFDSDQFLYCFTAAYSAVSHFFPLRMELPSSSCHFTAFTSWLYQISWFSRNLWSSPVLAFVLTFVCWLVFTLLPPSFFAIL